MKTIKTITMTRLISAVLVSSLIAAGTVLAQEEQEGDQQQQQQQQQEPAVSLEQLLSEVRRAMQEQAVVNQQREQEFLQARNRQQELLQQARNELAQLEARSEQLKAQFDENERQLAQLETILQERLGNLGELFGVTRQVASEAASVIQNSLVSAQYPGRAEFLYELAEATELPTTDELERLWYLIQHEITHNGQVVTFNTELLNAEGELVESRPVTRIGVFSVFTQDGDFLQWNPPSAGNPGRLSILPRQPSGDAAGLADEVTDASPGEVVTAPVDPSRGAILSLVIRTPTLAERIDQGGAVGYFTLALGALGLILVIWRAFALYGIGAKVNRQLKSDEPRENNPLGRIMKVGQDNAKDDVETMELKLDEAILKETGPLERGLTIIRIIYILGPLLGLLGTVVGMIQVFQQITLFGTGDPALMAGGISQALVTTVIGLVVAIPLTFLHGLLSTKANSIIQTLEEQAAGIVAEHAEKKRA